MANLRGCPFCGETPAFVESLRDIGAGDHRYYAAIKCTSPAEKCPSRPLVTFDGESGYRVNDVRTNLQAKEMTVSAWNQRSLAEY